jgi:hypothetical protein
VIHGWTAANDASQRLRQVFLELLDDWGAFLQTALYRDAIVHFFGGPEVALRRLPIYDGDVELGTHEVCLLADDTALVLTALKDGKDPMRDPLRRLLSHTKLKCLQGINMDNHDIAFRTLLK